MLFPVLGCCGQDGRRGFLRHLAVAPDYRRRGQGTALTERCLAALRASGIRRCHLMVIRENAAAQAFWRRIGWVAQSDFVVMSRAMAESVNA